MSKLLGQINHDLKAAMMARDAELTSALRMLMAALHNKEISLRQNGKAELTDEQVMEVISGEIKKRKESVLIYQQGKRQDLADKEANEIKILERYLPAQLSEEELKKIVQEIVETQSIASVQKNFGKIMGQVMAKVKGRAEGGRVNELVKKALGE